MTIDSGAVVTAAVALTVPLALRGLAWLFPAPPAPDVGATLEELRPRYQGLETALGFGALAACAPVGYGLWHALRGLAALRAALLPPAEVVWVATPYYWAVPAIFLAIGLAIPIGTALERLVLRGRLAEYLAYQRLKWGMDASRVSRLLLAVVGTLCAGLVFLGLDWSVRLERDVLVLNRYLSVGDERFAIADVAEIRTAPALVAPNGNRVYRREWVVRFAGGRSWTTNNLLSETPPEEKARLIAALAERSGVAVEEVEVLGREEL